MADEKKEKPAILKFVKPEMDLYVAEDIETPDQPNVRVPGQKSKWKSTKKRQGGRLICTCDKVCTCNLVSTHRSRRSSGGRRRRRSSGGYRRVCSCVPVAH